MKFWKWFSHQVHTPGTFFYLPGPPGPMPVIFMGVTVVLAIISVIIVVMTLR
jgi:hypothetical protein